MSPTKDRKHRLSNRDGTREVRSADAARHPVCRKRAAIFRMTSAGILENTKGGESDGERECMIANRNAIGQRGENRPQWPGATRHDDEYARR